MVPRRLGKTGLLASPISLGTTKLGRNTDVKYPQPFDLPSDQRVEELLAAALELGVNVIDTAPSYGDSELRLGPFVAAHRERIVLCTKCGERYENGRSIYDFSARAISKSVDESLRRLRTDRIDILLLHSDGRDVEILKQTAALDALARLKSTGKAGAVGISAKTAGGILAACRTLDVVMAPFSQRDPSLAEALGKAHDAGLGVMAIKGLASGYLEPAAAIGFALRQPFIDSLVVGTINPDHLQEAVAIANSLSPSDNA
jgi:aryl-alcohol dehydrogenase-like predicted oxidoreductase